MSNVSSDRRVPAKTAPDSERRTTSTPWNPWVGVAFVVILYFSLPLICGVLLSIYPALRGWSEAQIQAWFNASVPAKLASYSLALLVVIGSLQAFLKYCKSNFATIGLRRPNWRDPLYGLAGFPIYILLYVITVAVVGVLVPELDINQKQHISFQAVQNIAELVMIGISLVVLVPIMEEILIRGFLYTTLKKAFSLALAVVITSLLFAAAHLAGGEAGAGLLYIAAIDTFILSLVLIYLREKTGNLWASITLHALKNGVTFFALFVLPFLRAS